MGNLHPACGCCDRPLDDADALDLRALRVMLQGQEHKSVASNGEIEINGVIKDLSFDGSGRQTFHPRQFMLRGLHVHCTLTLVGQRHQLMQFLGADAALKLLDKACVRQGRRKSVSEMDGLPDLQQLKLKELGERSTLPGLEVMKSRPKSSDLLLSSPVSAPSSGSSNALGPESKAIETHASTTLQRDSRSSSSNSGVRATIHSLVAKIGDKRQEYNLSNEKLATILEKAFAQILKDRLRDHAARHHVPWQTE
mmetsp:Transcript_62524/g.116237  ORF Transcript_62524/g.116237 Transcript_62524/m.116237 type:complete len:253 (-) Transcript_62524:171-929(-)